VSPTDPNTGIGSGPGTLPGGGPGNAGPALVSPVPGQLDPHPVDVTELHGQANDDGSYAVEARWWSGIAPCNVLDSVRVDRDDTARTLKITVLEGHGPQEIACIDIAQEKATIVVLGKLSSGHWTISAEGEAPPLPVDVP
jgi:hypothetical protein